MGPTASTDAATSVLQTRQSRMRSRSIMFENGTMTI